MPNFSVPALPVETSRNGVLAAPSTNYQLAGRIGYIGVADALRIVRRRRWLIILVLAAALLATMLFLVRTRPVYSTTTAVMVLPSDNAIPDAAPTATPTASEDATIQTKVELLQARSLARQIAQSLQLARDPEFAPGGGGPSLIDRLFSYLSPPPPVSLDPKQRAIVAERARAEAITNNLMDHVSVERVARSNVINITASSVDPVKAARIANRLVDTYINDQIDDANSTRAQQILALSGRVANIRAYLERSDSATAAYRRNHGLLNSQPESNGSAQVAALSGILAQARGDSAETMRKAAPAEMANGEISASSVLLTELQQQEALLARKQSELSSFYGPGYPEVVQTSAELGALRTRIAEETSRIRADLSSQAAASQAKSGTISAAISGIRAQSFGDGQAAVPLRALERNVDAVNTLYTTLLGQLNAKIGSPPDVNADISRISRAPVPDSPSYPLPKRVLAVMALAALALGTLVAFVIEAMDTRLRTAEQVRRLLGIPTLAMIPEVEDEDGPIHRAVTGRPRSRFAEAMRNLLIEIESRAGRPGSQVVMVTSPLEGEGKNTVATSLAAAASVIGRHVVIVDFDLRRPGITSRDGGGAASGAGVVAYLSERAVVEDLVPAETEGRFAVIEVGEAAPDPGALIASPRLPQLLAQLRERFELVILNAPPVLPVRDAKTLADNADATLLVLRWGRTSPEAAAAAIEIFDRQITGVVLNRVDYEVHAKRRYGDAIHHIAQSATYYEVEPRPGRLFGLARLSRSIRRAMGRTAEALHLA